MLSKTDVARYEVTWTCLPHSVSAGRQKNIAAFGKIITEAWATSPEAFDVDYYKGVVAKAIATRAVDAAIPAQSWYPGSILRQLTTYTLALMSERMSRSGLRLDFDAIWRAQRAPKSFVTEAMRIARLVLPMLQEIPEEQVRNRLVTEWTKREACWDRVRSSHVTLSEGFVATLARTTRPGRPAGESWSQGALIRWKDGTWKRLYEWDTRASALTPDERDLVERAAMTSQFKFKGFRLKKLKEAWKRAVEAGFV